MDAAHSHVWFTVGRACSVLLRASGRVVVVLLRPALLSPIPDSQYSTVDSRSRYGRSG